MEKQTTARTAGPRLVRTVIQGGPRGNVELTADLDTEKIIFVSVRHADGELKACGIDTNFAPAWAQGEIQSRAASIFEGSMYWLGAA